MKALYRSLAAKNRVKPFKRNYNPHDWDDQDPVNKALSASNAALYGVVHSVLAHLAATPRSGSSTPENKTRSSTTSPISIKHGPLSRSRSP